VPFLGRTSPSADDAVYKEARGFRAGGCLWVSEGSLRIGGREVSVRIPDFGNS
jgi:hypothetical protein